MTHPNTVRYLVGCQTAHVLQGGNPSGHIGALGHLRVCDLSGQLAGAGATRILATFGAQVIRIEDPVTHGLWDIVRSMGPPINGDTSNEGGSGFNNHNVEKFGITLNLRTERGRELLAEIIKRSDVVTENFSAGVMERLGFGYDRLQELRPGIVYVSNCGFGQTGPYRSFKSWGPIAQAVSGITFASGLPDQQPAGWGYSYMDHTGAYLMAVALLAAVFHQRRSGEGQWVDMSCTEAGAALHGTAILDYTVNGRAARRDRQPNSNRNTAPHMVPHGIYPTNEPDRWVAVACQNDDVWARLVLTLGASLGDRFGNEDEVDRLVASFTSTRSRAEVVAALRPLGVAVAPVATPPERIDHDPRTAEWGLWPTARHTKHGDIRVDGLPVHLERGDWQIQRGGPLLGEDNERVLIGLLGLDAADVEQLRVDGII